MVCALLRATHPNSDSDAIHTKANRQTVNSNYEAFRACVCDFLLSIAIPDSIFVEESTLRDKTMKAASVARSASIFGVSRIYLYRDASRNFERDYETARLILQYAETPQYLRKALFPKNPDLEYAGLIPPLRTPHHITNSQPKIGEIREAALVLQNGIVFADVGARELALYEGKGKQPRDRVTVRVESIKPLKVSLSDKPENVVLGLRGQKGAVTFEIPQKRQIRFDHLYY